MTVDTSDARPITCMDTSIDRKNPIREVLPMQKNILSIILCWSPISLIEPSELKEALSSPGLCVNISHKFMHYSILSVTSDFISKVLELESFGGLIWSPRSLVQSCELKEFLERGLDPLSSPGICTSIMS